MSAADLPALTAPTVTAPAPPGRRLLRPAPLERRYLTDHDDLLRPRVRPRRRAWLALVALVALLALLAGTVYTTVVVVQARGTHVPAVLGGSDGADAARVAQLVEKGRAAGYLAGQKAAKRTAATAAKATAKTQRKAVADARTAAFGDGHRRGYSEGFAGGQSIAQKTLQGAAAAQRVYEDEIARLTAQVQGLQNGSAKAPKGR